MRTFSTIGILIITIALVNSETIEPQEDDTLKLINAINNFTIDFYKEISKGDPENSIISSPLSAKVVLALLSLGAKGETLEELSAGLHFPDTSFIKTAYKPAIVKIKSTKGITLKTANKIFITDDKAYEINPEFQKNAIDVFSSEIQGINFKDAPNAVKIINTWVEEQTEDKVKDLLSVPMIPPQTILFLINAIYFEAKWKNKFPSYGTRTADFHLSRKNKVKVEMMSQSKRFPYADVPELDARVLEMPYIENEASMVIILPNEIDGIKSVENKLTSGIDLVKVFRKTKEQKIDLEIPKFKVETELSLTKTLKKLNIRKIFDGNAELSGIIKNESPISVSNAIQKAYIEVSEDGTVAAAATALGLVGSGYDPNPRIEFVADHPFIFCIKTKDDVPLFFGKYYGTK